MADNKYENESIEPLEQRLAQEARRMLTDSQHPVPVSRLRTEFVRRRRARMQMVGATAAMIAVALGAAGWLLRLGINVKQDIARATGFANSSDPGRDQRPFASDRVADVPQMRAEAETVPFGAIAVLIPQTNEDGKTEFITGWYVPGQIEEIDARDLSPAERSAVSQLLGVDYEFPDNEII